MIHIEPFGITKDGEQTSLFTISNHKGASVKITDYGGTVIEINVPDRNSKLIDVALGFETLADFEKPGPYFGCIIGRNANRIANGRFEIDGNVYQLAQNNGLNNLHGGPNGFDKRVWAAEREENSLKLYRESPDGECGFPGTLKTWVSYTFNDQNELRIDYQAETDAPTVVNLTNHLYFNLAGGGDILGHELMINADLMTLTGPNEVPTGEVVQVASTPFDFRASKPIGQEIDVDDIQLKRAGGYDHNFVLNSAGDVTQLAARAVDPISGRVLEMFTTEPGVQLYTGNSLNNEVGKDGTICAPRTGFCLEAQKFPDAINHPHFPSPILRPGETYRQTTIYRFSAE